VSEAARPIDGGRAAGSASPPKGPPRFVKDSLRVLGGQVAMTAIGMGTSVITARWLGPYDRGLFQLLTLLPTTLSNFVKLGIPQASVYYMRHKRAPASAVASNAVWLACTMGTALAVACWFGRDWVLGWLAGAGKPVVLPAETFGFSSEAFGAGAWFADATAVIGPAPRVYVPVSLVAATLALIPFALVQFYLLGIAQAQERFREYNIRQIVPNLLSLVGMFVVLIVFHMGLVGAVLTQAAIVVFMSLWLTVRVHREAPLHPRVDGELLRGMLGFGGKSYVQTLAATLHLRIDQYLIAFLLGSPEQVAFYAIGVNLVSLLLKIPEATGTVLFPRLAASEQRDAHAATVRVCRNTLFLTALGVVALAVAGPLGIPILYGHKFDRAIRPMLILLPGALMMALYQILTRSFTSHAKQEINIAAAVIALCLNVGLNLVLIPRYGIEGAALANGLSYGTAAMILLVVFVRQSGHSVRETLVVGESDVRDLARAARRVSGLHG
jgi:O-antigen/teichoic acid export membrane protein